MTGRMRRKAPLLLLAVIFMVYGHLRAAPSRAGETQQEDAIYYTVVKGDTLWDITERFFKDPFKWPEIWKRNPQIKNPHLIYPGDVIKVTPDGIELILRALPVEKLTEEVPELPVVKITEEEVVIKLPTRPAERISSDHMKRDGFLTDEELDSSGVIVGSKNEVILLHEGQEVFLSFKEPDKVEEGQRYTIFLEGKKVYHPVTGKYLGRLVDNLGSLVVTKAGEVIEGRIDLSFKEIEKGAKLTPYTEPVSEVAVTVPEKEVEGVIVAGLEGKEFIATNDIVYLDKGRDDGLVEGNLLTVYRERTEVKDPLRKEETMKLPPKELGMMVIIDAKDKSSTGIVLRSLATIHIGDKVTTLTAAE